MSCCHYQPTGDGLDTAFTVDASRITFGRGCLEELGDRAQALGMTRVALPRARRPTATSGLFLASGHTVTIWRRSQHGVDEIDNGVGAADSAA
jgi:hypothetical protein